MDTVRASTGFEDFDRPRGENGGAEQAVGDLLRQVQTQFADLTRGRDTLAHALREMESQLAKVTSEATNLKAERDHLARLKTLYERKFASIRDLTQS